MYVPQYPCKTLTNSVNGNSFTSLRPYSITYRMDQPNYENMYTYIKHGAFTLERPHATRNFIIARGFLNAGAI